MVLDASAEVWAVRGAALTYFSVGGFRYDAKISAVLTNGTLEIVVDAGNGRTLDLTNIPLVGPENLERGCCCRREDGDHNET